MFDIRYDKDGLPIKQPNPIEQEADNTAPQAEQELEKTAQSLENLQEMTQEIEQEAEKEESIPDKPSYDQKPNDRNVRALREKAKRADELERERDELMRAYIAMQSKTQNVTPPEEEFTIAPGDLVEGKHLTNLERKYQKKLEELEKKYAGYEQKNQEMAIENRIKYSYPDFDKVVSPENIEYLRENEPELAQTLNSSSDLYSKAVSAYKLIKKLGIYRDDNFQQERSTAQRNAAKPKSSATISPQQGESPLSNANAFANGLTKDLKNKLWAEMNEIRKNS